LSAAIEAAGGVGALARSLGLSQPSVSNWQRVPAERVLSVETITGIGRAVLRPDLYPSGEPGSDLDPIEAARCDLYTLLGVLLGKAPEADQLRQIGMISGDASPLGMTLIALSEAAATADPRAVSREYFNLFIGVGRGELLPYASYYLTGFLHERPLAEIRQDFGRLGVARSDEVREPEDHIAILSEVMAGLIAGEFPGGYAGEKAFFEKHLKPWAERFFADLEQASGADFYRPVARLGRLFMSIESRAFDLPQ
jgi:TorA maturation chaperone TorD